jgi:1,4-alpha-glucan branching enzyme
VVVCNFTPVSYSDYQIGVPYKGRYKEIFSTEEEKYGGYGMANPRLKNARPGSVDGREYYISTTVEPLSVAVYNFTPLVATKKEDVANEAVSTDDVKDKKNSIKNKKIAVKKNTKKDRVISTKASEVSKAVSTKVNEVSKSVSSKAEKVSKSVTSKADEVSKKVASKASEVKIKAEEAKEFIAETVTVAADDVKKASKAKKNKNASKSK